MLWRKEAAVLSVTSLRQVLSEIVIEYAESLACLIYGEQEKVSHEQRVEDEDSHQSSPENYMGPCHDRVRQVNGAHADKG